MWKMFSRYWPQIPELNSEKIREIGSTANICFAKLSFFPDVFVYFAVTVEQL